MIMRIEQRDLAVVKAILEKTVNITTSGESQEERVKNVSLFILYTHEDGSQSKDVVGNIEIS